MSDTPDPLAEETLETRLAYTGQFLRVYEDTVRHVGWGHSS